MGCSCSSAATATNPSRAQQVSPDPNAAAKAKATASDRSAQVPDKGAEVKPTGAQAKALDQDAQAKLQATDPEGAVIDIDATSSTGSLSSDGDPFPAGPLVEGQYLWRPSTPIKTFCAQFGEVDVSSGGALHEVSELTLTDFLGSGAEGTVYKASYRNQRGEAITCAVKFSLALPDYNPDTHAAIDLLTQREHKVLLQPYERERQAQLLLRPKSEQQWLDLAGGPVRMVQFLGFQDSACALLLELCPGGHPGEDPAVMQSVIDFLKDVEAKTSVEVGDIKFGNMLMSQEGKVTVIDCGNCQYTGKATCKLCNACVDGQETTVDVHAQEHVAEYLQEHRHRGAVSRLRLQEFCYGRSFC